MNVPLDALTDTPYEMSYIMQKWLCCVVLGLLFLISVVYPVYADGGAGSSTGQVLRTGAGAEIPATGDARAASVVGSASLDYNAGGLARTRRHDWSFMYQKLVEDITLFNGGMTQPVWQNSTLGFSFKMLNYGDEDRTILNTGGGGVSSSNVGSFEGQDLVGSFGIGHTFQEDFHLGVNLKYLRLGIDDVHANGIAMDFGGQYRIEENGPLVGFTLQNLGPDVTFDERDEQLPALARIGFTSPLYFDELTGYMDVEKIRDRNVNLTGGINWEFFRGLSLRGGYDGRTDVDNGLTAGLGLTLKNLEVDYAYLPFGEFGNSHRFGFTWYPEQFENKKDHKDEKLPHEDKINDEESEITEPLEPEDIIENHLKIKLVNGREIAGETLTLGIETSFDDSKQFRWEVRGDTLIGKANQRIKIFLNKPDEYKVNLTPVDSHPQISATRTFVAEKSTVDQRPSRTPQRPSEATPEVKFSPSILHIIEKGENLWNISEGRLKKVWEMAHKKLSEAETRDRTQLSIRTIYEYWRLVVEANLHRLKSDDPDLVYPGEEIFLPPVPQTLLPSETGNR